MHESFHASSKQSSSVRLSMCSIGVRPQADVDDAMLCNVERGDSANGAESETRLGLLSSSAEENHFNTIGLSL